MLRLAGTITSGYSRWKAVHGEWYASNQSGLLEVQMTIRSHRHR